jgi:pimeloyl-ACP methyl ester carboxylesterase
VRFSSQLGVLFLSIVSGCAHWGESPKEESLSLEPVKTDEAPALVEFQAKSGVASYKFKKASGEAQDFSAEWLTCEGKESKGTLVVTHDQSGVQDQGFCRDWLAQAVLAKGYAVLAVQRPGFGKSTGSQDIAGPQSVAAIEAAVKDAQGKVGLPPVRGAYGYGLGAAAASMAAKKLVGLEFIVLGGGVYDLEDTMQKTSDPKLRKDIADLKKRDGDRAIEDRSVAYDVSGLPKKVAIYHGKLDGTVPPSQAKAFSDSLESSGEYKVSFQIIDGVSHDVAPETHRKIVEALLDKVSKTAPQ